jgi:hypothetical protein
MKQFAKAAPRKSQTLKSSTIDLLNDDNHADSEFKTMPPLPLQRKNT